MTFALTGVHAYGQEAEEPRNKRYLQYLRLVGTAANTDTAYAFGSHVAGSLGTFWDAVDGSEPGDTALKAIRDIAVRARAFLWIGGTGLNDKAPIDASRPGVITKLDSDATAGGNATETCVVTGLLTTDVLLGVTQFVDGAGAGVAILAYGGATGVCSVADALSVTWNADPGAGAKIRVAVLRTTVTVPDAGTYQQAMGTMAPNITFASGSAPTAYDLTMCWQLKDGEEPVAVSATSSAQSPF